MCVFVQDRQHLRSQTSQEESPVHLVGLEQELLQPGETGITNRYQLKVVQLNNKTVRFTFSLQCELVRFRQIFIFRS